MFNSYTSGMPVYLPSELSIDKERTVCITGHREKFIEPYKGDRQLTIFTIKKILERYIDLIIKKDYRIIISGLASGTDLWASDYILKKKRYINTLLIGAMPFLRHAEFFSGEDTEKLKFIERFSDILLTTNDNPDITYGKKKSSECSPSLYRTRNFFMVDNSSVIIAFCNDISMKFSGTAQTLRYAEKQNKIIIRFGMNDVFNLIDKAGTDPADIYSEIKKIRLNISGKKSKKSVT